MKKIAICIACMAALGMSGCVTSKKYNEMKGQALRYENDLNQANTQIAQLSDENGRLQNENDRLGKDRDSLMVALITTRANYDSLKAGYNALDDKYKKLLADGSAEAARMLRQLEQSQAELSERSRKIEELNAMLRAREEALDNIRRKVSDALVGFEGKGLTISVKEGQVYVSMEDKLLFKSGSYNIDPRGEEAIKDLANVLAQNPDINVIVEGHTDNVPYKGSGDLKDNLDLSVKRATTVTRLLLTNKGIVPERITAAGRGESLPIDNTNTVEGRARNRRTEIILTPKIDELMRILSDKQ